jgi:hypothetical protein
MRMTLLNMVFSSVSFGLSRCLRYMLCPEGVPSRAPPSANGQNLRKGTQTCYGDRSPHLEEARGGFWQGERASEGRGCLERGTLHADRKANRKGAYLFKTLYLWYE